MLDGKGKSTRAAQYVRMSTDHQQYSTRNQADALAEFATRRGLEIVRTFVDAGKSGLSLDGRDALKELIDTVQSGRADFDVILVYDVSRWGRFQDADESAYYEYLCKKAGIRVLYCAEGFENDDSPISTIVKSIKRAMAGEYSRELSAKVFKGQCNLIRMGFRQGGQAGYGLRRLMVDAAGAPKEILKTGEQKSLQTDRVILVPGPPEERAVVREIYRLFVHEAKSETRIAAALNEAGVAGEDGSAWTQRRVAQVLKNEKYVGHNVYNRLSSKLRKKRVSNPESEWIRREAAFEPIVSPHDFEAARERFRHRRDRLSEDSMLDRLKALAEAKGRLSAALIDATDGMPSSAYYRLRFGSLAEAYRRTGRVGESELEPLRTRQRLAAFKSRLISEAMQAVEKRGGSVVREPSGELRVNGILSIWFFVAQCRLTLHRAMRWVVRFACQRATGRLPDFTVAVRLDANQALLDYFVLPALEFSRAQLCLKDDNGRFLDAYRCTSLDSFFEKAARIGRVA